MHSSSIRLQNLFGFFTTTAFFVTVLTALSVVLYPARPSATVDVVSVKVINGRPNYYSSRQQEYAFISFDLDADLHSLFNWNTKQVFCWLSIVYGPAKGSKHTDNEAVIWDAILPNPKTSRLSLRNEKAKYNFNDITGRFLQRNATVRFGWNVNPHVGTLTWGSVSKEVQVQEVHQEDGGEGVDIDLEKGGKHGEGWTFTFPPVGGRKKTAAVEDARGASV